MTDKKRAVGYVRLTQKDRSLSSEELETSIINQENEIKEYCRSHNLKLLNIYREKHMSGDSPNRPTFNQMRDDAVNKEFDYVVVRSMSRFTREGADKQEDLIIEFGLSDVEIISMTEDIQNELTRQMLGFMNKVLIIFGRIKTRQMRRGKKALGIAYVKASFGYKNLKKQKDYWKVNDDAEKVKELFRRAIANASPSIIMQELKLSNKMYYKILNNKNYIGITLPDGKYKSIVSHKHYIKDSNKNIIDIKNEAYFGFHEPLISPQDWLKLHPEDKDNELIKELVL